MGEYEARCSLRRPSSGDLVAPLYILAQITSICVTELFGKQRETSLSRIVEEELLDAAVHPWLRVEGGVTWCWV